MHDLHWVHVHITALDALRKFHECRETGGWFKPLVTGRAPLAVECIREVKNPLVVEVSVPFPPNKPLCLAVYNALLQNLLHFVESLGKDDRFFLDTQDLLERGSHDPLLQTRYHTVVFSLDHLERVCDISCISCVSWIKQIPVDFRLIDVFVTLYRQHVKLKTLEHVLNCII
jgi:hypothetical protein